MSDVVVDLVTGLMWQRTARPETVSYVDEDVPNRCSGVRMGGYGDWRLPRLIELISLIDFASDAPAGEMKVIPELADTGSGSSGVPHRHHRTRKLSACGLPK